MRAPRLDRRITIQKPQTSRGADGSILNTWVDFATVSAGNKDVPSARRGESFGGDQFSDVMFTEWTIRHLDGLDGTERVIDDGGNPGNLYGLPATIGRKEFMILTVERGRAKMP